MKTIPFGEVALMATIQVDHKGETLVGKKMTKTGGRTYLAIDLGTKAPAKLAYLQGVVHDPDPVFDEASSIRQVAINDDTLVELVDAAV